MPKRNGIGIALLADETRRQIVAMLAERSMRPSAIAAQLQLSRPATSRQLALLREAGLVRSFIARNDHRGSLYYLNPDVYRRVIAWLAGTDISGRRGDQAGGRAVMPLDWNYPKSGPREDPAGRSQREIPR